MASERVRLDADGRIAIPPTYLAALSLKAGDDLVAVLEEGLEQFT